jgi:hypothetical protein
MTRDEHITWTKTRALNQLDAGDPNAMPTPAVSEFIEGIR